MHVLQSGLFLTLETTADGQNLMSISHGQDVMPGSASDDLLSKSKLLRQRIEARKNPEPTSVSPPKATPRHQGEMVVVVAEKPKRSPFRTLAYATVASVVLNLPYFLYQANAEPDVHNPFAAIGEVFLNLICFLPPLIISVVLWCYAIVLTIIQVIDRASARR